LQPLALQLAGGPQVSVVDVGEGSEVVEWVEDGEVLRRVVEVMVSCAVAAPLLF
jgi:hypothetical protein